MDPQELTNLFVNLTSTNNRWLHLYYRYVIRKIIRRYSQPKDRIIDLGCACGLMLKLLADDGYTNLQGIDEKGELIAQIRDNRIKVSEGNYLNLDRYFTKDTFDTVIVFNTIHHLGGLQEYKTLFKKIWRITKNDGLVLVKEPCKSLAFYFYKFLASSCSWSRKSVFQMEEKYLKDFFDIFYPNINEIIFHNKLFNLISTVELFFEKMFILRVKKRPNYLHC